MYLLIYLFFFKQKTAYDMRISDWSSDACSSDLRRCLCSFGVGDQGNGKPLEGQTAVTAGLSCAPAPDPINEDQRQRSVSSSEERRVGKECVSTCRSRWSPYH